MAAKRDRVKRRPRGEGDSERGASRWGRGIWRTEVLIRVRELRHRLELAQGLDQKKWPQGQSAETRKAIAAAVEDFLDVAEKSTEEAPEFWARLSAWWTGSAMTTGWESVHEAELKLISIESEDAIRASLPWLQAWMERAMESGERRTRYERALKAQVRGRAAFDRTLIEQAFKDVIVANNERFANLRAFRNSLVLVTGILAGLVATLAVWHLFDSSFLTLCSEGGDSTDCLDGSIPQGTDVALVALIGAIGGLLAIAFGLAETETAPSRFDPKAWQALLKPVAGAATALGGVLLIQADILLGPSDSRSEALLLAYALLFGFSQQLFTRFVDKRADELIGTESGEDEAETEEEELEEEEEELRSPKDPEEKKREEGELEEPEETEAPEQPEQPAAPELEEEEPKPKEKGND